MRKPLLTLSLWGISHLLPAQPAELILSKPTEVTVYQQGAQVSREASVNLKAGRQVLRFTALTPDIDPNSIQLSIPGVTLLGVTYHRNYLVELPPSPEGKTLIEKRDELQGAIDNANADLLVISAQKDLLKANQVVGGEGGFTAEQLRSVMDFTATRLAALETDRLKVEARRKEHQTELNKVNQQLAELENRQKRTSEIHAEVTSAAAKTAKAELRYRVSQASWSPAYDLRAEGPGKPVALVYKARVRQQTGEDWNNVKLRVTSADPLREGQYTPLSPYYLNLISLQEVTVVRGARAKSEMPQRAQAPMVLEDAEMQAMPVTINQGVASFSFNIDMPYTVATGGEAVTAELSRNQVPASFTFRSVPKYGSSVFLTAALADLSSFNLLSGDANVFLGNEFVGQTYINAQNASDSLRVSFGADSRLAVSRTRVKANEERKLFGSKITEDRTFEIVLKNNSPSAVSVAVEDQIPVSQDERIAVKLTTGSGAQLNTETGKLTWNISLQPNEEKRLRFTYQVTYPSDEQLWLE